MTEPLKPCPWCGGTNINIDQFSERSDEWRMLCESADCQAWGPERKALAEARAAWNRRAPVALPTKDEIVAALTSHTADLFPNKRKRTHEAADAILALLKGKG